MNSVVLQGSGIEILVGKILCLGRNFAAHAREMDAGTPSSPIVFIKPATALLRNGGQVVMPAISRELHHEVEMVVLIGKNGKHIHEDSAMDYVAGYAVGLDMTLRDVQADAKKQGLPWSVAKGFDTSAPVSTFVEKSKILDPYNLNLSLNVNGILRQQSNTRNMIFRIEHIIAYLSSIFTLEKGDLLFMGTPEGVGSVTSGDQMEAELESVGVLRVGIR